MNTYDRIRNLAFRIEWKNEDADKELTNKWRYEITDEVKRRKKIINDPSHHYYAKNWFVNLAKVRQIDFRSMIIEHEDIGGFHIWEPDYVYNRNMSGAVEFVIGIVNDIRNKFKIPINFTIRIIAEIPNLKPRWVSTEPLEP